MSASEVCSAQEGEHADTASTLDAKRERADQLVAAKGDVYGELAVFAVVPPPRKQPGVEKVGAGSGHRPHETVPGVAESGEPGLRRDRLERDSGRSRVLAHKQIE
jgi:hypothetical protein